MTLHQLQHGDGILWLSWSKCCPRKSQRLTYHESVAWIKYYPLRVSYRSFETRLATYIDKHTLELCIVLHTSSPNAETPVENEMSL